MLIRLLTMAGADDNKPTENESVSNDMEVNDEENVREGTKYITKSS